MPISIRLDAARKVTYATATGVITDAHLLEMCRAMLTDPEYDPSADQIFDAGGIERLDFRPATLQEAAELFARVDRGIPTGAHPKVAIVAPNDVTFGVARMYEAYREMHPSPKRYFVCRTMEEARRWLGLPDGEVGVAGDGDPLTDALPRVVPVEFRDRRGVHWTVAPHLIRSGPDVVPDGFLFSSEHGERRFLHWDPKDFFSPREVDHGTWRELLRSATVVT